MTTTMKLVLSAAVLAVLGVLAEAPNGQRSTADFNKVLKDRQVKGWGAARKEALTAELIDQSEDGDTWKLTDAGRSRLADAARAPADPALQPLEPPPPDPEVKASVETAPIVPKPSDSTTQAAPPPSAIDAAPAPTIAAPSATEDLEADAEPTTQPRLAAPTGEHPKVEGVHHPSVHDEKALSPCCKKPSGRVDDRHRQCACGNTFVVA